MASALVAIAIGVFMLLCSMLSYGVVTAFMLQLGVQLIRSGYMGASFGKNAIVMTIVLLATAAAHLVQIALWALVLLLVGEMSTVDQALYLSAQNYTALGYGDITLSAQWRLLGPLEAINGLLLFGLSTAVMFSVLSRLIANRLHAALHNLPDADFINDQGRPVRAERRREARIL